MDLALENSLVTIFLDEPQKFLGNRLVCDVVEELVQASAKPDIKRRTLLLIRFSG
ncbi:hypothetical protein AA103581_2233 [Gluconobacter wancherniae NBRC 103581]|nr:hypothetical protein AA103581_2233 [Gluconobacter wancherniae NBRC 103581]